MWYFRGILDWHIFVDKLKSKHSPKSENQEFCEICIDHLQIQAKNNDQENSFYLNTNATNTDATQCISFQIDNYACNHSKHNIKSIYYRRYQQNSKSHINALLTHTNL